MYRTGRSTCRPWICCRSWWPFCAPMARCSMPMRPWSSNWACPAARWKALTSRSSLPIPPSCRRRWPAPAATTLLPCAMKPASGACTKTRCPCMLTWPRPTRAAQLLEMELQSPELAEYTQVIVHEADRLQSLVDRLLAPHRHPHQVGDVNIHEGCERVRSLILVEYPHGLRVQRDYDTSIPEFRGDRAQLIQALLNIVQNAAQALSERIAQGDACITLRTRVARQVTFGRQRYRLAPGLHVIDNGPGVPDAIRDRIFYPLVSGRDGGSGLGLTLAQTFVQQHHGMIECESAPGRTDFRILIPLP